MTESAASPKNGQIVQLDVRCGHCYHFKKQRADRYTDICARLGVLEVARPCSYFLANVNILELNSKDDRSLVSIINQMPSSKLAAYAAIINQEKTTRRAGYRLGQLVYIRLLPDDYLNNYAKAWVLAAKKKTVLVQGKKGFRGSFMQSSILTEGDFAKKRQALIARKRINDPNYKDYLQNKLKLAPKELKGYEPPTIDDVKLQAPKLPKAKDSKFLNIRGG